MTPQRARWVVSGLAALTGGLLVVYLYTRDMAEGNSLLPKCAFYETTGLYCTGCGNTRATYSLLHGNITAAADQNLVFVIALPFLLVGAIKVWYEWISQKKTRILPFRWKWGYSLSIIAVVSIFTILRNVPVQPFSWLAPDPIISADLSEGSSVHGEETQRRAAR